MIAVDSIIVEVGRARSINELKPVARALDKTLATATTAVQKAYRPVVDALMKRSRYLRDAEALASMQSSAGEETWPMGASLSPNVVL